MKKSFVKKTTVKKAQDGLKLNVSKINKNLSSLKLDRKNVKEDFPSGIKAAKKDVKNVSTKSPKEEIVNPYKGRFDKEAVRKAAKISSQSGGPALLKMKKNSSDKNASLKLSAAKKSVNYKDKDYTSPYKKGGKISKKK